MINARNVAFTLIIGFLSLHAKADIVTLKDGTTHEGTVIKENGAQVVLEIVIANIKTTKTFPRYKVRSIDYKAIESEENEDDKNEESGEQNTSDLPEVSEDITDDDESDDSTHRTDRRSSIRDRTHYMVIPVEGMIGVETNAYGLRNALLQARRRNVEHIIFEIDSGGGYVYDAVETLKVLKEFDDEMVFHAVVREGAISAASVYVAGADNIWMCPGSRVGGAVAYSQDNSTGATEVDAKFNSIWAAEVASRAESKGHSADAFRAMVELTAELWLDAEGSLHASRPRSGAEQIDDRSTILTMRADQIIESGMGKAFSGDLDNLGELLEIESWAELKSVGRRMMSNAGKEREQLQERFDESIKVFRKAFEEYEQNNPRSFDDYVFYRRGLNGYAADGNSVRKWRERCDLAVRNCDDMLAALARIAEVQKRSEKIGALHLNSLPSDIGHDVYTTISDERAWLSANRSNVPSP